MMGEDLKTDRAVRHERVGGLHRNKVWISVRICVSDSMRLKVMNFKCRYDCCYVLTKLAQWVALQVRLLLPKDVPELLQRFPQVHICGRLATHVIYDICSARYMGAGDAERKMSFETVNQLPE